MPLRQKLTACARGLMGVAALQLITVPVYAESVYDKVLREHKIVAGADEGAAPFGYVDDKGQLAGWGVDLSRALTALIEKKMGVKLDLELVKETPETRIPMTVNGTLEWVLGTVGKTVERQEVVAFSLENNATCVDMLTRKDSPIKSYQDLAGKRVGVTNASVEQKVLTDMAQSGKISPPPTIVAFPTHAVGFLALQQGRTDAHVTLASALQALRLKAPNPDEWAVHGPDLFCIPSGIILPLNDQKWANTVNNALCYMIADGDFDKLYDEWFGAKTPKAGFSLPMSDTTYTVIHNQCPFGIDEWLPKK
jgi:glutamate/aspartate transport system substrate-binding protein